MPSNYDNIEYIDSASIMVAFLSGSLFGTSSYALTASYALNGGGSSVSASWASQSLSASYSPYQVSSSYALSASYAPNLYPQTYQASGSWASSSLSSSYSLTASYSSTSSISSYASNRYEDIDNGLIVYYPFSEGTGSIIHDYSISGLNAINLTASAIIFSQSSALNANWNSSSYKAGGYSLQMDGMTSAPYAVPIPSISGLPALTVAIWFNTTASIITPTMLLAKVGSGGTGGEWFLEFNSGLVWSCTNSTPTRNDLTVAMPLVNDGKWHYVVATYNGIKAQQLLYVDGKLIGSATVISGSLQNTNQPLQIGCFSFPIQRIFSGLIDEFKMWNRDLSIDEIRANWLQYPNSIQPYFDAYGNEVISGSLTVTNGITGSLNGIAAQALTASYISCSVITASLFGTSSYSYTASYALNGGSGGGSTVSSSWASSSISSSWSPVQNPDITDNTTTHKVGINNTTPHVTLDVNGNICLSGYIVNTGSAPANTNMIGANAGNNSPNASYSNMVGNNAGNGATNAAASNFIGPNAGQNATNAYSSIFIGNYTGNNSANANNSIFIGYNAGNGDSVNNGSGNSSILIGDYTSTGGNSDSIAIGKGAQNSTNNQLNIGNVLFASNINSSSIATSLPQSNGRIGIGKNTPVNALDVLGNISCSVITASLFGTASYANTAKSASYFSGSTSNSNSSSYALTASYTSTIPNAITAIDTLVSNYSASSYNKNHFLQCSSTLTVFLPDTSYPTIMYLGLVGNVTVNLTAGSGMTIYGNTIFVGDGASATLVQTNATTWEVYGTSTTGSVQTLYNNLVAFWPLDQASSLTRIDSYGFHSITGGGGLSSTPGKTRIIASGFSTAYLASSNQPEADAKFNFGPNSFTLAAWVNFAIVSASIQNSIISKFNSSINSRSYALCQGDGTAETHFLFHIYNNGTLTNTTSASSITFGIPSANTWYHVAAWYDSINTVVGIRVNAGPANTTFWPSGSYINNGIPFMIGSLVNGPYMSGSIQDVGVWSRVLTQAECALLYNNGNGRTYPFLGS